MLLSGGPLNSGNREDETIGAVDQKHEAIGPRQFVVRL